MGRCDNGVISELWFLSMEGPGELVGGGAKRGWWRGLAEGVLEAPGFALPAAHSAGTYRPCPTPGSEATPSPPWGPAVVETQADERQVLGRGALSADGCDQEGRLGAGRVSCWREQHLNTGLRDTRWPRQTPAAQSLSM